MHCTKLYRTTFNLLFCAKLFCLSAIHTILFNMEFGTIRAPVFGRHQFFGTSEHYGKVHGSLLSGWMNYNYTACCWFPTSSNIVILPAITVLTNQVWKLLIALFKVPNTGAFTVQNDALYKVVSHNSHSLDHFGQNCLFIGHYSHYCSIWNLVLNA